MTVLSERVSQSVFDGSRLRVVLLLDLHEGAQARFLQAYEEMHREVAAVPGHIVDQLCQSIENPSQWLITSEWESAPPFLAWINSEEHVRMVQPLHDCVRNTRSLRYAVLRETGTTVTNRSTSQDTGQQAPPRLGDGVVRHALTFTVKPGTEEMVAKHLSDYASPSARVDDSTRLRRTSLFMHGNRVVRAVEVEGDLLTALRHVARQPEVQAVEEAINPYLELERDLSDPLSARTFFTRAALPMVHHLTAPGHDLADVTRHGLYYQAKEGRGMALAQFLAGQDEAAADDPASHVVRSTIFQRDDSVVRIIDVNADLRSRPEVALGIGDGPRKAAVLGRLLQGGDVPTSDEGVARLLDRCLMTPLTDRTAPES
ncbi:SchA/CurD-like domain-containing protein [Streptomyces fuscigenes]|uniref:SchA/CurD-like domain-containing protein n=1 Tax=Streptomyces fuscigenes TaxID=1528880 RepID=UPI001F33DE1F|nr:SchA/CurD-like domain-containing protein [Streptomyces fuscigenes]MCF3962399.1 antibiotic biosynthesis monooxygenase [Streptomyces fuscigenes]